MKELQTLLTSAGFAVKVDGIFGIMTAAAVRSYQGEFGLTQDALAGPKTMAMLRGEIPKTDPPPSAEIWGIDVSEFQPVIPWQALADIGCSFVIPRGFTGADKRGEMREDRYARQHMASALAVGIECPGFYGWMSELRSGSVQGAFFANLKLPGFAALDYEPGPGLKAFRDGTRARREGTDFIQAVETAGKKCPVYTAQYAGPFLPSWATRRLWLARPNHPTWPDAPMPWGSVDLWQSGFVPRSDAVKIDIDRNVFRGDRRALTEAFG